MTSYAHGKSNESFIGGVFDGESVWMIPLNTGNVISFIPPRFGRPSLHTTGSVNAGSVNATSVLTAALDVEGDSRLSGDLTFSGSKDSASVADEVTVGGYEIGPGNRVLAIGSETTVVAEVDETKFSHKLQVRINGANYYMMLTAT